MSKNMLLPFTEVLDPHLATSASTPPPSIRFMASNVQEERHNEQQLQHPKGCWQRIGIHSRNQVGLHHHQLPPCAVLPIFLLLRCVFTHCTSAAR